MTHIQSNNSHSQASIQLFKMFSNSPKNNCIFHHSIKTNANSTFEKSQYSSERAFHSQQLSNSHPPFNSQLKQKNFTPQSKQLTDRYIPSRKLLKNESLYIERSIEQNEENNNSNNGNANELNSFTVGNFYKKFVMSDNKYECQQFGIKIFENNNMLRYNSKNTPTSLKFPQFSKTSQFQFDKQFLSLNQKKRKISKLPYKVLDAPALQDDYYLNLIDWSTQNFLAVGLSSSVYLWNAENSKVTKLCDLGIADSVTSVSWALKGPYISLGTNNGQVQIWDISKMKRIRIMHGHANRVGTIAWSRSILSTGSRDKTILHRDTRANVSYFNKLVGHKQEVCGLKWSIDQQMLCSGGNDNKLMVWNGSSNSPIMKFCDHNAAVKAMAWSPHQHGLLVSGGGSADRTIKFRNTLTGTTISTIDAGSQVCNIIFSKAVNEIVSTHGYSHNEINIWKYPKMDKIATLSGHTYRVLYLAMSPDGSTIVSGAGDETLRFWNIFPNQREKEDQVEGLVNYQSVFIR